MRVLEDIGRNEARRRKKFVPQIFFDLVPHYIACMQCGLHFILVGVFFVLRNHHHPHLHALLHSLSCPPLGLFTLCSRAMHQLSLSQPPLTPISFIKCLTSFAGRPKGLYRRCLLLLRTF